MPGRIRRRRAVVACALVAAAATSVPAAEAVHEDGQPHPGATISNGTVKLGVNEHGQLNFDGVGVQYVPTGHDGTFAGCECEGWGAGADGPSRFQGRANNYAGIDGVSLVSFAATETTATSVVDVLRGESPALRVTHDFVPSPQTPNLYEITVTLENLTEGTLTDVRYIRQMDWDIEPTAFSEFVTINRGAPPATLIYSDDNGFADNYPFSASEALDPATVNVSYTDNGPRDHGARFIFSFGELAPGEERVFVLFYGAAGSEASANGAVSATAVEVFSYGQPNTQGGATEGTPNTFIWGFRGVGGTAVIPPTLTLTPATATNDVGTSHTVTAELEDSSGRPVPSAPIVFEVSGANAQKAASATTGADGKASFTYTGTGAGTDAIKACLDANQNGACDSTEVADTAEKIWGEPPPTSGSADIGVTISAAPQTLDVGQQVAYTVVTTNFGPFPATGAGLTVSLPGNIAFNSVSTSRGTCAGGATTSCSFGTLGVGESATVGILGTATARGRATTRADVGTSAPDPNVGNNNSATVTVRVGDESELPPPVPGEGNGEPLAGRVLVNGVPVEGPVRLENGDVVNTVQGTLAVETVNGAGQFARGTFQFFDVPAASALRRAGLPSGGSAQDQGITEIRLAGGNFRRACVPAKRGLSQTSPPRKRVRALWGNTTGRFRTRGRHSSATVRGTVWLTSDRCDGTFTYVRAGSVTVLDFALNRQRIVRAGKGYLAKPKAPAPKRKRP